MSDRYYVDRRVGCVALRDRTLDLPDYPGLWDNTPGVVKFWPILRVEDQCETCGHITSTWTSGDTEYAEAIKVAEALNTEEVSP